MRRDSSKNESSEARRARFASPSRRMGTNHPARFANRLIPPMLAAIGVLIIWSVSIRVWELPAYLVPKPSAVATELWHERVVLAGAFLRTGRAALLGLGCSLIVGTAVGILFSQFRWLRYAFFPYAIFLQTVPIVAIAPLLVIWFGHGTNGIVAVAFVLSLFPMISNVTAGMMTVPTRQHDLFTLYRATRWQRLWKLQFPHALPALATGLKTSSGLAVIGAIVGEFFVGYGKRGIGLGYLIRSQADSLQTAGLFSAVLLSTLLGILVFGTISFLAERFVYED